MQIFSLIYYSGITHRSSDDGSDALITIIVFLIPFAIAIGYVIYKNVTASAWDKGIFPQDLDGSRDNILEAYVCLSGQMLRADGQSSKEKIEYMSKYFRSHLGNRDFRERLNWAYRNEIDIKTITSWLELKLKPNERSQVLYFLVGLSIIDGTINSREKRLLDQIREFLQLSPRDLDSIIASYYQQRHRKQKAETKKETVSSKKSAIQLSAQILGVSEHASMDEVKKAYRKMAKLHHPDRFATQSEEQQKIAEQRFLEIQKAYETLDELK